MAGRQIATIAILILGFGGAVPAEPSGKYQAPISGDLEKVSSADLEERIRVLAKLFDDGQSYARIWQNGFTGAWAAGIVVGTMQASLSSEPDNRVPALVTAGKAVIGTTRLLLSPHPGRLGSTPLGVDGDDFRGTLEARVVAGEAHLLEIDHKAHARKSWIAHAANVGLNVIGGGLILGLGNPSDAISNVGVGILFGELMLWTMPARGEQDLKDYQSFVRNGRIVPSEPEPELVFSPTTSGVLMRLRF